jgi:hypothetical protein
MLWLPGLIAYAAVLVVYLPMNRREIERDPAKAERYRVLPLPYKMACWMGILPLFSAVPLILLFVGGSAVLATAAPMIGLVAYLGLEIACIRVYRRHGLWN